MLPSSRDDLFRKLIERYKLERMIDPPPTGVLTILQPITDADALLREGKCAYVDLAVTTTGIKFITNVPQNKRWKLWCVSIDVTSGTLDFDVLVISDRTGVQAWLDRFSATTAYQKTFTPPVPLGQKWSISVDIDSVTVAGTIRLRYMVEEEDEYL